MPSGRLTLKGSQVSLRIDLVVGRGCLVQPRRPALTVEGRSGPVSFHHTSDRAGQLTPTLLISTCVWGSPAPTTSDSPERTYRPRGPRQAYDKALTTPRILCRKRQFQVTVVSRLVRPSLLASTTLPSGQPLIPITTMARMPAEWPIFLVQSLDMPNA